MILSDDGKRTPHSREALPLYVVLPTQSDVLTLTLTREITPLGSEFWRPSHKAVVFECGVERKARYVPFCPALAESCCSNQHIADRRVDRIPGLVGGPRTLSGDLTGPISPVRQIDDDLQRSPRLAGRVPGYLLVWIRAGRVLRTLDRLAFLGYVIYPHSVHKAYPDIFMPKALKYPTKILIGIDDKLLKAIDGWRREQDDLPTRSEAIRRLVGLSVTRSEPPGAALIPLARRRRASK
jgi:hypothetical protein